MEVVRAPSRRPLRWAVAAVAVLVALAAAGVWGYRHLHRFDTPEYLLQAEDLPQRVTAVGVSTSRSYGFFRPEGCGPASLADLVESDGNAVVRTAEAQLTLADGTRVTTTVWATGGGARIIRQAVDLALGCDRLNGMSVTELPGLPAGSLGWRAVRGPGAAGGPGFPLHVETAFVRLGDRWAVVSVRSTAAAGPGVGAADLVPAASRRAAALEIG